VLAGAAALPLGGCGGAEPEGFAAAKPAGWHDATSHASLRSGTSFQLVYEGPKDGKVTTSIAIVRSDPVKGRRLDDIVRAGRRNVGKAYGDAGKPIAVRLDGARALQFDYDAEGGRVRQVATLHDQHFYLLSFTAAKEAFQRRLATMRAFMRSWRWK
jgi:YD repeat-containing protein